jgi:hypothetical protein
MVPARMERCRIWVATFFCVGSWPIMWTWWGFGFSVLHVGFVHIFIELTLILRKGRSLIFFQSKWVRGQKNYMYFFFMKLSRTHWLIGELNIVIVRTRSERWLVNMHKSVLQIEATIWWSINLLSSFFERKCGRGSPYNVFFWKSEPKFVSMGT